MRLIIMLMALLISLEFAQPYYIRAGDSLKMGEKMYSYNKEFFLTMQNDGNLCVYTAQNEFVWCNAVFGFSEANLTLTKDGNLVVFDGMNIKWSSQTHPDYNTLFKKVIYKPAELELGDDGLLTLINSMSDVVWSNKNGVVILDPNTKYMFRETKRNIADYFRPKGGFGNFSLTYVYILTTMISVEDLVKAANYKQAKIELDKLWALFPIGNKRWSHYRRDDKKFQTNNASPLAYNSLRMLTDIVDYNLKNNQPSGEILVSTFRVILVGCSEGIQPYTVAEMLAGGGRFEKRLIDTRIKADNYRIINQASDLFRRYINAITQGKLDVKFKVYELNNYCAPTYVSKDGSDASIKSERDVLDHVPKEIIDDSEFIYLLYPGVIPADGENGVAADAGFGKYSFCSGGMGGCNDKAVPVFIANDKSLLTKHAHLGKGDISDIERRSYLPQWFQHEIFHYFYFGLYPNLRLEVRGHDWFDRTFWAADFEGTFETDYYSETLHKRIQQQKPLLAFLLNPRIPGSFLNSLNMSMFIGKTFDCSDAIIKGGGKPNLYHYATIIEENGKYFWKNRANAKWVVVPDFKNSKLLTKDDCPYKGMYYNIIFKRMDTGEYINQIEGISSGGQLYIMK